MTSAKKRERGQGGIGHVPGSRFFYIWYHDNAGKQHRESTRSTLRSVAQEMLNQRLAAMGRGEKSPTEIKSIRYEDMRQILIDTYRERKIGTLVEEKQPDGTVKVYPHKRNVKVLDEFSPECGSIKWIRMCSVPFERSAAMRARTTLPSTAILRSCAA
jgi:hypothetical protein